MSVDPVAQINQLLSEGNYQQALQSAQQYGLTQTAQIIQALIYVQQAVNEAENGYARILYSNSRILYCWE